MKFIRDIIKEKRNASTAAAEDIHDPSASNFEPGFDTVETQQAEPPFEAQEAVVEQDTAAFVDEDMASDPSEPAATGIVDDAAVTDPKFATRKSPEISIAEEMPEEDEIQELLKAVEQGGEITQLDESDDAFEPLVLSDGQPLDDPFEKLRKIQTTDVETPPVVPRVSALGRVKPRLPKSAVAAATPKTTADTQPVDALTPLADAMEQEAVEMPSPAAGRGSSRSGRVKTRLLGFSAGAVEQEDPFEKSGKLDDNFPVGWLVVISEMGRGASFALHDGVSKIGRGTDQTVCLNFGDNSISRDNHISIAFDAEQNKFFIGHSGKTNLVRINNVPLLSTEELNSKDLIRLGETTLRFIAFCEDGFGWEMPEEQVAQHA